jgi:hypothetical protein
MANEMTPGGDIPVFKNDPIMVLILGLVTCNLYNVYWNMKMAEVLNAVAKKETISQPIAILGGCCWPVGGYFYYLAGSVLSDLGRAIGKEQELKDKSTLMLILGLFVQPVAAMILQGHVNELYAKNS